MNAPQKYDAQASGAPASGQLGRDLTQAFWRAIRSQMHPRMIFALFVPFMVIMVVGGLLLWFGWAPLTRWLGQELTDSAVPGLVDPVIGTTAFVALKAWLIPVAAAFILLPLAGIAALAVAAIWVMPMILAHVGARDYPDVQAKGQHASLISVTNAVWVTLVFVVGWMVTLPLWLIAPLGLILSVFWWTFAFTRLLRVDALVEHASVQERRELWQKRAGGYWSLGLCCALINLLPPAWIFLPVFSGLLYAHYSFEALRQLRRQPEAQAL